MNWVKIASLENPSTDFAEIRHRFLPGKVRFLLPSFGFHLLSGFKGEVKNRMKGNKNKVEKSENRRPSVTNIQA